MKISKIAKIAAVAIAFGLVATTPVYAAGQSIQGSGASFPTPLIEACKAPFAVQSTAGDSYSYASSSSGTGQSNSDKSIGDFWMSDSPYTATTRRATLIHVPLVAAPIAVLYNFPTSSKSLQLSADTVAGIFAGTITMWNDPAIAADNNKTTSVTVYKKDRLGNPVKDANGKLVVLRTTSVTNHFTLPNQKIIVVYRSDSSGTTSNFTNYLYKSSPSIWTIANNKVFTSTFPGKINSAANLGRIVGAASSTGVSQLASKTPYSITYAEVNYAATYKLKIANLINPAGNTVSPDNTGVGAFLASATQDAAQGFLTYDFATKEPGAYPLGVVSYMLADTAYPDKAKAAAVKAIATFILSDACANTVGAKLGFSTMAGDLLKKAQAQVAKIG